MSTVIANFPPTFRRAPRAPWLVVLGLAVCAATLGCKEEKPQEPERTEPWRKDDTEQGERALEALTRFRIDPGQHLEFSVPTRKTKPTGSLAGITGEVDVALRHLPLTSGTLRIDLNELAMDAPAPTKKSPPSASSPSPAPFEPPVTAEDATRLAKNWLGLGKDVTAEERTKNRSAVFEIQSLRALSHVTPHTGALRKSEGGEQTRQVLATAEGELSLRGYTVARQIEVTLLFHYSGAAAPGVVPRAVEVSLRPTLRVPLAEYRVEPRDESGNVLSEQLDLVGKIIGSQATITGKVQLSPAAP